MRRKKIIKLLLKRQLLVALITIPLSFGFAYWFNIHGPLRFFALTMLVTVAVEGIISSIFDFQFYE